MAIFLPQMGRRRNLSTRERTGLPGSFRRLVVAQGGRLFVENRPEGGARFTVVLPLLRA